MMYKFDVFISYSHHDEDWVRNWLLPRLEHQSLKVCIDYRDFEVGASSPENMENAMKDSAHTLIVLTPAWIASEWTNFEAIMAQTLDPSAVRRRVLPILLSDCDEIPLRLRILTYADFRQKSDWGKQLTRVLRCFSSSCARSFP